MSRFSTAKPSRFAALFLLPVIFGTAAAMAQAPKVPLPKISLSAGIHLIHAEVASDDASRAYGLMFRKHLEPTNGMLFEFPQADIQCFWMRNTLIPLSAAFIADDGSVVNIEDMAPRTDTPHCSEQPVRYVLEMNQGWFAQRGIGKNAVIKGLPSQP